MRLVRLDLIRYGHFTDASLQFEPGFNLVYGPNEAGKSTTLRALRQLLFGFDHQCSDGFLHPNSALRIGAVLEDERGERLECIRRKRNHDNLRGPDDTEVLSEQCLQRLLDGMDGTAFRQRFGIDYQQLVEGGREICAGHGDLGEILFAAASGIAALGQIQEKLAAEAGELFKPSGTKPILNQLIAQLREVRGHIKQLQLPTQDWETQEQSLQLARRELAAVNDSLQEKNVERRRLEKLEAALPLIARRKVLIDDARRLAAVPLLPEDFSERRQQAQSSHAVAVQQRQRILEELEALRKDMAQLPATDAVLKAAMRIKELQTEYGSYRKAQHDRLTLARDLEQAESEIRTALRQLGRAGSSDAIGEMTITRQLQTRIQRLALQRENHLTERKGLDGQRKELARRRADAESQLAALPADVAVDELRCALESLRTRGPIEQQQSELEAETETQARTIRSELARLGLASLTPEAFVALPAPELASIDRFIEAESNLDHERQRLEERIRETEGRLSDLQLRIEQLRLEEDVPTPEDLENARQLRNEAWQWVQRSWRLSTKEDRALRDFLGRAKGGDTVEAAFEHWLLRADQIADRLRREAHRVAEKAQCLADLQALQRVREQQRGDDDAWQQRAKSHEQAWKLLWREVPITVRSPREMRAWCESAERLRDVVQQYFRQRDRLAPLRRDIAQLRERLVAAVASHTPFNSSAAALDALTVAAEQVLKGRDDAERRRLQLEENLERLAVDEQELRTAIVDNAAAQQQWQVAWAGAMKELAIAESSLPEEAAAVVEATKEVLARHQRAEATRERIAGIDADAQRFEHALRDVAEPLSGGSRGETVQSIMEHLSHRLETAQKAAARRTEMERQLARAEQQLDEMETRLSQAAAELEVLRQDAGGVELEQLPQLERDARQRALVLQQAQEVEAELQHLAGNDGISTLLAAAEQLDRDHVAERLERIAREIPPLEAERDALTRRAIEQQSELDRMDGRAAAAEKHEEAASLVAAARSRVEQFLRLRFATAVLRETVDRYRAKHQTPVLQRASELFAALTLGHFSELRVDTGERGQPVLVGVRPDGKVVHVEGMSTGASDQLYLALRVASLEHYFQERRALPFIIDDVLVMFDDQRAAAALQAFAELAKQTQVIFFTHHQHLLEVASAALPPDAYTVLRLPSAEGEPALSP